ncbi:hypothetical protein GCM10010306_029270 [Streptomyces umbrinus]|nr:hypothetical protein GCM10010306_029270 [Streptomyces umbrinus]GHH63732.1 hypothetical protein GCM10018775_81720 [Streptomyces umbrinus]
MPPSAERDGFVREGMLRSSAWVLGEFLDEVLLGLLVQDRKPDSQGRAFRSRTDRTDRTDRAHRTDRAGPHRTGPTAPNTDVRQPAARLGPGASSPPASPASGTTAIQAGVRIPVSTMSSAALRLSGRSKGGGSSLIQRRTVVK